MRFADILRLCRQNLLRRKSRTVLTVLGVVVGCCSIVLMVSLGAGINEQNERMLESMGDLSIITVYKGGSGAGGGTDDKPTALDDQAIEEFRSIPQVAGVTPMASMPYTVSLKAGGGDRYVVDYVQVMGIDTTQLDVMGYMLLEGRAPLRSGEALLGEYTAYDFTDRFRAGEDSMRYHSRGSGGMCVAGESTGTCREVADDPDPFFDPLTTPLTLVTGPSFNGLLSAEGMMAGDAAAESPLETALTPVGILKEDYNKGDATSSGLILPLDDLKQLIRDADPSSARASTYDQVLVKVTDMAQVGEVEDQIRALGFGTSSVRQMRESLEEQSRAIQLILGGIGAVSLLVAAIGIANTMVMSVTERTREIGIMKSLGCTVRDIRIMFLGEAGAIGCIGGAIGCVISAVASVAINLIAFGGIDVQGIVTALVGGGEAARVSVIPWWLYLFALAFSTAIGLLSGFQPANRAVRIPALDAIRNTT